MLEPAFLPPRAPLHPARTHAALSAVSPRPRLGRRRPAAPAAAVVVMQGGVKPSFKARLKEETERPFARVREFLLYGSAASASIGAFIAISRVVAALGGVEGVQPLRETVPNVAIDLGVIAFAVVLLRWDARTREKRLERMSRGAMLASLKVQMTGQNTKKMSDFRGQIRPVVVVGNKTQIESAMNSAKEMADKLDEASVVVVPVLENQSDNSSTLELYQDEPWFAKPVLVSDWNQWIKIEREMGKVPLDGSSGPLIIFVRRDGRVGSRSMGMPSWGRWTDQIKVLPLKDKYGAP